MNIGAVAFWLFLAAIIVAGSLRKRHLETLRHETLRLLIEKGQKIDEAQLKELLNPPPPTPSPWTMPPQKRKTGDVYRSLRVFGTIILFIALGLGGICLWRGLMLGFQDRSVVEVGTGVCLVAGIGAGIFFSSRFVSKPPPEISKEKQDQ
jgi:uncharacterized protein YneF (UPF0154 family)